MVGTTLGCPEEVMIFSKIDPRPRLQFENYQNIAEEPILKETTVDKSFINTMQNLL